MKHAMAYEFERNGVAHLFIRGFDDKNDEVAMKMVHVKRHENGKTDINEVLMLIKDNEHDKRAVEWMMQMMEEKGNE